jgi:hypothetical protein
MVLHGEGAVGGGGQPFAAVVVEVDVRGDDASGQSGRVYGETVIVAGDLHRAALRYLHRLIAAAMAEFELVGLRPQRQPQNLMPQADAEDGFVSQQLGYRLNGVGNGRRIARPIRKEDTIRFQSQRLSRRRRRRDYRHPATISGQQAQNVALDAKIIGYDVEFRISDFGFRISD